jgi:transketolase
MPCWERFERQDQGYRDAVLPPAVKARVSIEAAATLGWQRWVGDAGVALGIDHFGASAPAAALAKAFGFTAEHVAETASALLQRT